MRRTDSIWPLLLLSLAAALCLSPPGCGATSPDAILPPGFSGGWVREGKAAVHHRDTLFEHINGEAELYLPYGFDTLNTAAYANKRHPDALLIADVYRMGSLLNAFGIYSNYRKVDYETVQIGAEGFVSPTQCMFYQERYFVRLQATGTTNMEREAFLACARAISAKLPLDMSRPAELARLSIPAVIPGSERYHTQSLLGYAFFRRGFTVEGVAEGRTMRVFVVTEETPALAGKALDAYRANLAAEGQASKPAGTKEEPILTAEDPLYGKVVVTQSNTFLIGAIKVQDEAAARRLIEQLREKLGTGPR